MTTLRRRAVLAGGLASPFLSRPALAAEARVVIIGGGFAGASLARALATNKAVSVRLIEPNETYLACPLSNQVLAGLRPASAQDIQPGPLPGLIRARAVGVDPAARRVSLDNGQTLQYDRLVISPGIDFDFAKLPGSEVATREAMPHAWKDAGQIDLLRRQLAAMEDGGLVVMTVPDAPYRCPPAPYERASLIAHVLKTTKPRSKLIILDAKEQFSSQRQFQAGWERLYKGLIEWLPPSQGGAPASVDAGAMSVASDFDTYKVAVANIIPPQRAGAIAAIAGVADRSGWCPIDPVSFESSLQPGIHVIGDAAIGGALPKSATAAHSQAIALSQVIENLLNSRPVASPRLESACYNLVAPQDGFAVLSAYHPAEGMYAETADAARSTPLDASPERRAAEAAAGLVWFNQIIRESFGA